MDWLYPFAILIGTIITLMGLGLPVAFAFFATNILGLMLFFGGQRGITQMVSNFSEAVGTYALAPLPMFLVMGSLYFRSGLGERVIHALDIAVGNLRGWIEQHGEDTASGDPLKMADAIYTLSQMQKPPLRTVLGGDAYAALEAGYARSLADIQAQKALAESVMLEGKAGFRPE